MKDMGTPANGFCKPRISPERREPKMTIREAVAKYGDDWRLMAPGTHFVRREHMERETDDTWDAMNMKAMETGEQSRIRTEDIRDER